MTYDDTHATERLERLCNEKHHHETKRQAREAAAKLRKKYGYALFVYKCQICHKYLITSQPQNKSDIMRTQRGQRAPIANSDHTIRITKEEPNDSETHE